LENNRRYGDVNGKKCEKNKIERNGVITLICFAKKHALVRLSRLIGLEHSKQPILEKKQKVWKTRANPTPGDFKVQIWREQKPSGTA